jgi:outer membrane murein-binding lipoprotein Lpp
MLSPWRRCELVDRAMKLLTLCAIMGAGLVLTGCGDPKEIEALKGRVDELEAR